MIDFLRKTFTGTPQLKALTEANMRHPVRSPLVFLTLPRTKIDYKKEVGTGLGSSSVMAPVQWIQRAFPEAPLAVYRKTKDGREIILDHPLADLINNPNPYYSGISLWWASIFSWITTGNIYWLIEKNSLGIPIRLWWTAPWLVEPKYPTNGGEFLTGYEYSPGGQKEDLEMEDVFHIKHGIDPDNPRVGISPIHSCLREIWNDDEASNFVASLLRNSGVPGLVISPDTDSAPESGDVDASKQYFKEMFSGDRRGEPLVMSGKTKVDQFGFDPKSLDLSAVRDTTEERVCAALGIPAAVVGFGAGLQQTKVGATMKELRQLAWNNGILPMHTIFAYEIERFLLPMFESMPENYEIDFDISKVTALDDDLDKKYARAKEGTLGGFMEVAEAREMVGLDAREGDHIYLRPASSFETPAPQKGAIIENGKIVSISDYIKWVQEVSGKGMKGLKEPTAAEGRAIDNAPKRPQPRSHQNLMRNLESLQRSQSESFAKELTKVFDELGKAVAEVADERLKAGNQGETKLSIADFQVLESARTDSEIISSLVDFGPTRNALRETYASEYDKIARATFGEANTALGLGVNLPDPAAVRIAQRGGTRVGLVDLQKQVKDRLFTTIAEAREQGLGPEAIARQIRADIPQGRWSTVEIRARVIARTETKFAQNASMIEFAKATNAQHAMIFDARLGDTDEECEALNGVIVTLEEAETLVADEHPNGTRSFTPWYEPLDVVEEGAG